MSKRKDDCCIKGCEKKSLNYTGIRITDQEVMLKMNNLMVVGKMSDIEIFGHCKKHWTILMGKTLPFKLGEGK